MRLTPIDPEETLMNIPARLTSAKAISFATALSAWLGGVAFCIGFRISAPVWVALILTVLNLAISAVTTWLTRRGRRIASAEAS